MKLISVIIPYYKKKNFIELTLNSVINQSYKNLEIIIIYDDINKEDLFLIKKLSIKDKRIKIIVNNKNLHVGNSRNKGIKSANGHYIALLDADDIWHKDKAKIQLNFMNKKKIFFSYTSYNVINKNNKIIGRVKAKSNQDYKSLIKSCDIGLSTVMFHRSIKNHIFFPNLKTKEDYVVWLNLAKRNIGLYGIAKTLVSWRRLKNSLSSSVYQRLIDGYTVYRNFEKMNIVDSVVSLFILSFYSLKKKYKSII
jgi:teichuronic acid biosynthesis glycosyltransferase TuaG